MANTRRRGAGGTEGGIGRFFIGFIMLVTGGYLFFDSIQVNSSFRSGFGYALATIAGFRITSGMVLMPFIFGIGMIFYNAKNILGWALAIGSLAMLGFGVITSLHFSFARMSAFTLISIFVLFFGGMGLFLSSLREFKEKESAEEES